MTLPTFSKVVIDGDQLVYAAGFACKDEPISHACQMVKKGLEKVLSDCGTEEYELYIGGTGNFREEVAITKGYKANRTAARPLHYEEIRDYMQRTWGAVTVDGMEVDDKVSMLLYEDFKEHGEEGTIILSSPDKDLNNTPGWHYNPRTREVRYINAVQAMRHFWYQMLCGDTVDNIQGLPRGTNELITRYGLSKVCLRGVGAGTAKKLMDKTTDIDDAEAIAMEAYCSWAEDEEMDFHALVDYMDEQGQLLWMIRGYDGFGNLDMWAVDTDKLRVEYDKG